MIVENKVNGQSADEVVIILDPIVSLAEHAAAAGWHWNSSNQLLANPAGEYRIQNALVDKNNSIGPWSLERTITLIENWVIMGCSSNQPCDSNRMAVIWRAVHVSTGKVYWITEGMRSGYGSMDIFGDAYEAKTPYPISSNNPLPYPLIIHDRGNAAMPMYPSTLLASLPPAPMPDVWPCDHPLTSKPVRWSWATISGETRLSPATMLPSYTGSGVRRLLFNGSVPLPCGVLGRYIYVDDANGVPRKQIADPRLRDTAGIDKYLFQPQNEQPILWSGRTDGPVHSGPSGLNSAWSIISPTQKAMFPVYDQNEHKWFYHSEIILPDDPYIYGPLIDPCLPYNTNAKTGVKGRVVGSLSGAGRILRQVTNVSPVGDNAPANNHPTYWPMIVEQCDEFQGTTWRNIHFEADTSRGPGASMAVTGCDYSGGQAFSATFEQCVISVGNAVGGFPKMGLHIGWECAAHPGAHTASEWVFRDCDFYGNDPDGQGIAISLCGTQTVNMTFQNTHMLGIPCGAILVDGGTAFFKHLVAPKARQFLMVGWAAYVDIEQLFIDQVGNHALVDFMHPQVGSVSIAKGQTCGFDAIARAPVTTTSHDLALNNWTWYKPSSEQSVVYSSAYNKMKVMTEGSRNLNDSMSIVMPSRIDYNNRVSMYPSTP